MGGLTTVPLDTLHFKLLITFWIKRNNKITVTYLAIHKLASNNSFCNSLPTEHEAEHILSYQNALTYADGDVC